METFFCKRASEVEKEREHLEKKLDIRLNIRGKKITFEGSAFEEYEASLVFEAFNFGFPLDVALMLKDEDMTFKRLSIKDFTRRTNMEVIKSRLIGSQGRTRKTLENIADCHIRIQDNEVGIIGSADEVEYTITAIANLIRGSKQANVYKFLERINTQKKEQKK